MLNDVGFKTERTLTRYGSDDFDALAIPLPKIGTSKIKEAAKPSSIRASLEMTDARKIPLGNCHIPDDSMAVSQTIPA
ncbi:MAG: hypothetical protein ABJH07_19640 [Sedimentitalea sp.]|uniref:hypothetical protein n=1 Tax=Sedimentitalea sp. TaxID=2048915 RepID=UPI0032977B39